MSSSIDPLAAAAHKSEPDPIEVAVQRAAVIVETRDEIRSTYAPGDRLPPAWHGTSAEIVARKVIASLLNAGWSPPSEEAVAAAVAQSEEYQTRFDRWRDSFSQEEWSGMIDHFSRTGRYPFGIEPPAEQP